MGLRKKIFILLRNFFALVGVICCIAGALVSKLLLDKYQLTPHQFALKIVQVAGIDSPIVADLINPAPKYVSHKLIGTFLKDRRPRLVLAGVDALETIRSRYRNDLSYSHKVDALSKSSSYLAKSIAWACGGDKDSAALGILALLGADSSSVTVDGHYGNGLDIALAYDLLANYPGWREGERHQVELKLGQFLRDALTVLDGDSASLWHGRMQLASSAWVAAAVLDTEGVSDLSLLARAQAHFLESVESIAITEGWPEGYNYWINNRAFPFVVACLTHLNSMDAPELNRKIKLALERVGLWTIHGTEPQGRFHLFGDTGPRNDLKDETQRVIDLIYMATKDPIFKKYSAYLSSLHGQEAYYRGYRWGIPLFHSLDKETPSLSDLRSFDGQLATAAIFGREDFGQVFIRSDWGRDATFVSFQAGDSFTHHGHYQAGHFTINKAGEPLAITSGTYGDWTSPHRLHYYLRTVAANSLLVLRPGENVRPNHLFDMNVAAGGQRLVMPTGSAVLSVDDWRANLGARRHYEGGSILAFEHNPAEYTYVASELTNAYNNNNYDENGQGGKVDRVLRSLVYMPRHDLLLVYDRMNLSDALYTAKWLLHSRYKPGSALEDILIGKEDNGILETDDASLWLVGDKSRLVIRRLLPENAVVRKIGGPDYRYYVETDGDDSQLDGLNMTIGASEKPWFDSGLWRLEIQPASIEKDVHFLVALAPRLESVKAVPEMQLLKGESVEGAIVDSQVVLFADEQAETLIFSYEPSQKKEMHTIFGVTKNSLFRVNDGFSNKKVKSSMEGSLSYEIETSKRSKLLITVMAVR